MKLMQNQVVKNTADKMQNNAKCKTRSPDPSRRKSAALAGAARSVGAKARDQFLSDRRPLLCSFLSLAADKKYSPAKFLSNKAVLLFSKHCPLLNQAELLFHCFSKRWRASGNLRLSSSLPMISFSQRRDRCCLLCCLDLRRRVPARTSATVRPLDVRQLPLLSTRAACLTSARRPLVLERSRRS